MSMSSQEPLKCPIKMNFDPLMGPVDTQEEVAKKWAAIKQWYKDHPEAEAPWTQWEREYREIWEGAIGHSSTKARKRKRRRDDK